jgi:hypothetical protein
MTLGEKASTGEECTEPLRGRYGVAGGMTLLGGDVRSSR